MAITIPIELGFEFKVHASPKDVFSVLSNVPDSASYYPNVQQLVDLGGGAFRWEMEPMGVGAVTLQTVYSAKYVSKYTAGKDKDKDKGSVVWTPVKAPGNALVSGSWTIKEKKNSTQVVLQIEAELTLPLPGLMKAVVTPVIEAEFERMTEQYIDNLIQRFGGEV